MTVPPDLRVHVRERANFACEYCGVAESDTGGELTVDHFQPQAHGGGDHPDNLLYCCYRCNQYKADYWPEAADDPGLWNPRTDPAGLHLLALRDGRVHPLTSTGAFTIERLRLNRPPLVAFRVRRAAEAERLRLLSRYRELLRLLEQVREHQGELLAEQRSLLEEQRVLLRLLIERWG